MIGAEGMCASIQSASSTVSGSRLSGGERSNGSLDEMT